MNIYALIPPILSWILFIVSFIKDRSKYRNCYLLFFALIFSILLIIFSGVIKYSLFLGTIIIFILILPLFLIINGITMLKREGRSLSHMLSFLLGLLITVGEIATFIFLIMSSSFSSMQEIENKIFNINNISMFFSISIIYISMTFFVFTLYCLFLQIIPKKKNFNYIIVLGAGLINGDKITKLLSDRIDKAIEIYKKSTVQSKIILSGGQGSDEDIPEAEAMKRYCLEKGIPSASLIKEDKSKTTYENLRNSKTIINSKKNDNNTVIVTSNYHVFRALRYCRKIKFKCNGVGSHVAFYYWPSALIREYVAIHFERKHLIILIIGWLLFIAVLFNFCLN